MLMVNANYTPADAIDSPCSTHLIDGDGNFNSDGIDNFIKKVKLAECGLSYAVIAIMGTQSSGKSTLLNNLFGTNFREMNAMEGSSQTTKGIWMAWGVGIEPGTIVMDLEGTDGSDRGEDDTAFEKQRALFALAVSDIVLINMCCHDIGREQGPNKPLLKTVFQVMMRLWCHDIGREQGPNKPLLKTVFQVMMRLFSPHKTTLMFVIRDKTRTPLENLKLQLWKHIQKIWDSVPKPEAHKATPLSDFFNVEVVALTSYEWMEEQFKEEVANLRQRFFHSTAPGGLAEDRRGVVPASGFSFGAQEIWKLIKENKDLDLPAHKVMVATMRCEEIADEKFSSFMTNEEWRQLEETVQSGQVPGFGKKLTSLLGIRLSEYDTEARHFEECVRTSKRKHLEDKLLQLVRPAYQIMLGHIRMRTLEKFKEAFSLVARDCSAYYMSQFDELSADAQIDQVNWDSSKVREELRRDIDAHILIHKLSELTIKFGINLNEALSEPVEDLLKGASDDTWLKIRKLLKRKTRKAVTRFSDALSGFEMDEVTKRKMFSRLEDHARGIVEAKAKEEAGRVLIRMKDRFSTLFSVDSDSMPREWTLGNSITTFTKKARSASLKLLSVMAAVRLNDDADNIEKTLFLALLDAPSTSKGISVDALASTSWDGVPSSKTLLTPVQCKNLWVQFIADTEHIVSQARMEKCIGMAAVVAAHVAIKVPTLDAFRCDIDAHIALDPKLSELTIKFETNLNEALSEPVEDLLEGASDDKWLKIRKLLKRKTRKAVTRFSDALSVFEMDEVTKKKMLSRLEDHSRGIVEAKAKEEAGRVLIRMKDRFSTLFSFDSDSMPRKWTQGNSITAFTRKARSASLKLLSVMAAVRLNDDTDNIEETLSLALLDTSKGISVDALASSSWDGVPSLKTLLTPVQCKNLWEQFIADTEHIVSQARTEKCVGMATGAVAHVAIKVATLGIL